MKLSQALTQNILKTASYPIIVLCTQSKQVIVMNKAAEAIYQYSIEELNQIESDQIFSSQKPYFKKSFFKKTKSGDLLNVDLEFDYEEKSGQLLLFSKEQKLVSEGLEFGRFSSVAQKIMKLGFWEVDLDLGKVFWSRRVHELHDTDPEKYKPNLETAIHFYREDYRDLISTKVQNLIDNGEDFQIEAVIITQNLTEKWIRTSGTSELVNGKRTKVYGSIVDITKLKESEQRFEELTNNLPGVAFQYFMYPDGSEELKNVSEGSERIFGFKKDESPHKINEIWKRTAEGGDLNHLKESIIKSIESQKVWTYTWQYLHPDGKFKTLKSYGSPTIFPNGTVMFNTLVIEVTEEARNKELLEVATTSAKIGSWEYDLAVYKKGVLYCSNQTKRILGMSLDCDPSHESFKELMSKNDAIAFQQSIMDLIKNEKEIEKEFLLSTQDNTKWVRIIAKGEHINGRCIKIYGSIQDITKTKTTELQFKDVLLSISDVFFALDQNLHFIYYNAAAEKTLLKIQQKTIGKFIWDVFPYFKDTLIDKKFTQVLKTGKPQQFEYLFPLNNEWYEVSVYSFNNGISVFFRSIQKRMMALNSLESSVTEKNAILNSIGDAFITIDNEWSITFWNAKAEEFTSLKHESVLGRYFWDIFKADVGANFYKQFTRAMKSKQDVFFEDFSRSRNKWFDFKLYATDNGLTAYITDITDKKLFNLNLEKASTLFDKVTEATNDAIWEWNFNEAKVRLSANFKRIFGSKKHPFLISPNDWKNTIHPEDFISIEKESKKILQDEKIKRWELDYRILNNQKEVKYLLERGVITRDSMGKPSEIIGSISDISNQKMLESQLLELNDSLKEYSKKLERSNTELEHYAFVTSHDLQEPLRMISSFLDLLSKKYGDSLDSKARKYIFYANEAAKRLKQIIIDLLHYSRVANSDEPKQEVDLNEIITDFRKLRSQIITETSASIVSDTLPKVNSYKAILTQIFHAILDNAIKYRKHGFPPLIDLNYQENENEYVFSIKDNGIGIEKQYFDKIFLLFQRLHNKDEYSGTGIGLTYVKRGLDFLGGSIWLESQPDQGTTFYFTIPK